MTAPITLSMYFIIIFLLVSGHEITNIQSHTVELFQLDMEWIYIHIVVVDTYHIYVRYMLVRSGRSLLGKH